MNRVPRVALVVYGAAWLVVTGFIGLVIHLGVPSPDELLVDVADRRGMWIAANAILIAQQALLTVGGPRLVRAIRARQAVAADAVGGLLAIAAGSLVASGVFHGVLGAHLADQVTPPPLDPDLVRAATTMHALGDTSWFVGIGALAATTAICTAVWWRTGGLRRVAWLGAAAVACTLLQFGWFADHAFGVFAAPGTLLQAAWFVWVGATTTVDPPVTAVVAPPVGRPPQGT